MQAWGQVLDLDFLMVGEALRARWAGWQVVFPRGPLEPRARHALAGLQTLLSLKLRSVAQRFGVSASRISHIQRALEQASPSPEHRKAMALCKVKQ